MSGYLLRRLAASLLLLLLVLTATFLLLHLAPGDPLAIVDDLPIPAAERQQLIHSHGLDRPIAEQYVRWLGAVVLHGDWGLSYTQQRPVAAVIGEAMPATLLLAAASLVIEYGVGVSLGVLAARRSGSGVDRAIRVGSLLL